MSVLVFATAAYAANMSGAIFTTTVDGSVVNANVQYELKTDVYLDGGPGPNAPVGAAGLEEGDYYFQVTDPSGQDLLSSDNITCRKVHVNAAGVIDTVYSGNNWARSRGQWVQTPCTHSTGIDIDHAADGAITVQLYPYDDTPNRGGVYKAWITPVSEYTGNLDAPSSNSYVNNGESYSAGNFHGFVPAHSKTDNYKVKYNGRVFVAPVITVTKFHDANMNTVQDAGEESITGWSVDMTDPIGVTNTIFTTAIETANFAGVYTFEEAQPAGTAQTVASRDGVVQSSFPTASAFVNVTVANTSGETHTVDYGNVGLGDLSACKIFDRNGNGVADADESGIPGWRFSVSGILVTGALYGPVTIEAGADGCATADDLYPGTYTVTELFPIGDWYATSAISSDATITSSLDGNGSTVAGQSSVFTNLRLEVADFGTKGYWHNPNGLAELTQSDIDAVNALDPYAQPSDYAADTDEPFDGFFTDGTAICTEAGADCGTFQAEVAEFLVEDNGGGTHEEQLAQQLLAFIFNVQHRVGEDAYLEMPDGSFQTAGSLIDAAIEAWLYGSDSEVVAMQELLESFNSNDEVSYVPVDPGPVVY